MTGKLPHGFRSVKNKDSRPLYSVVFTKSGMSPFAFRPWLHAVEATALDVKRPSALTL
jgi:hypothetical protein